MDQSSGTGSSWSMLVEKATAVPEPPPVPTRQQQMAQQQQ
jgi:hypothetical protein